MNLNIQIGASGLIGQQKSLDIISNNIANVNTAGFKAGRADFEDMLYRRYISPTDNSVERNLQRGHGVLQSATPYNFGQGAIQVTERGLDISLEGFGFMRVEDNNPPLNADGDPLYEDNYLYTRGGAFYLSVEEGGCFIVDSQGRYLLSAENERIMVPEASGFTVSANGEIRYDDGTGNDTVIQIGLYDFINRNGLYNAAEGVWRVSDNSGEAFEASGATFRQGALEMSNVDLSNEMTHMIRTQRAYQIASRVVTTADQMMGVVNNIRS